MTLEGRFAEHQRKQDVTKAQAYIWVFASNCVVIGAAAAWGWPQALIAFGVSGFVLVLAKSD